MNKLFISLILMTQAAAGGGLSAGANIWRVNSFSTNFGANSIWRR